MKLRTDDELCALEKLARWDGAVVMVKPDELLSLVVEVQASRVGRLVMSDVEATPEMLAKLRECIDAIDRTSARPVMIDVEQAAECPTLTDQDLAWISIAMPRDELGERLTSTIIALRNFRDGHGDR